MDTFVCSSWYYLRYPDAQNKEKAFDKDVINKMLPVDVYVGGKEHAAMHLIYARFMTKALRDLGYLDFDEPFKKLVHQGMILGPDGNKMSKSKGNTVSPDQYVDEFGSDVFRLYLMFGFEYTKGGPWKEEGIKAISRYLSRVENLVNRVLEKQQKGETKETIGEEEQELIYLKNKTIKSMEEDMEQFQFNTAIARSMEYMNQIIKYEQKEEPINQDLLMDCVETYMKLLSPLAPHFTEEQWEKLGKQQSIHKQQWPEYDEKQLQKSMTEIPIQINGKIRSKVFIDTSLPSNEVKEMIRQISAIADLISEYEVKKEVYVPGRIYSLVLGKQKNAVSEINSEIKKKEAVSVINQVEQEREEI